ncbi:hypothetical protein [Micromonospora mirobrigensis]|uniref:Uncharacterized protein n=1 Tax=Micromonospora mirobrigensis TaxID=262898 RepID=A0A1C5AML4_9ACTN|nr:hypothetical protein [Micromonospora mirobrigensis]SCF46468.1 hypothetical protein GA0070564_11390 [Micromonospora mirobrigensis]
MRTTATPPVDALEKVLGELPLPWVVTVDDLKLALLALLVHAPEQWPTGPLCRADRTAYPCLLHRWARRVLHSRGLPDELVDGLAERDGRLVGVPDGRS